MRMKTAVRDHVESMGGTMFRDATNAVRKELEQMCQSLRNVLEDYNEELSSRLSRDYLTALVGLGLHKTEFDTSSTSPNPSSRMPCSFQPRLEICPVTD